MKLLAFILLFLLTTLPLSSQIPSAFPDDTATTSSITIEVVDIITRQHVSGCTVTMSDTSGKPFLVLAVDSIVDTVITLKHGWYTTTITKPGYDTLVAEWFTGPFENVFYIDFYMRKETLTKAEKKEAARQSQNVPSHHPEIFNQGGFQHMGPGKKEILEWKVEGYDDNGGFAGSYSFLKVKYL